MTVLLWIVVVSVFGGALSVSCAALFALNARALGEFTIPGLQMHHFARHA